VEPGGELSVLRMNGTKLLLLILTWLIVSPMMARSKVYLTLDEALRLHFNHANSVERRILFLTDEQVKKIQAQAKARVESKLVTYYIARDNKGVNGYAFIETHIVRTMPETFMVILNPDGSVREVEMLAFYEPEDYLPSKRWLALFRDKTLQSDLWLKRGIQNIVGATLSAQCVAEGIRKILALYELAIPKEE